jgi:integrase
MGDYLSDDSNLRTKANSKKNRNKFINHKPSATTTTTLFEKILNTDMDFVPDPEDENDTTLDRDVLKENYVLQDFFKNKPKNTINIQFEAIVQFCLTHKITPEQLIKEALTDENNVANLKANLPVSRMQLSVARIEAYYDALINVGYDITDKHENVIEHREFAPNTIISKISAIKSFYEHFGIIFPKKIIKNLPNRESLTKHEYIYTRDEMIDILEYTDYLEKAVILAQTSSGISGIDLRNLSIYDYENSKKTIKRTVINDDGTEKEIDVTICMLFLLREKTKKSNKKFITFFSPEAVEAIDKYLIYRNTPSPRQHEGNHSYVAYQKRRYDIDIVDEDSTKNISLFVNTVIPAKFLKDRNEKYRKMSQDGMMHMYKKLAAKTGQLKKEYEWNDLRSHKMRAYFGSTLMNNTDTPNYVKYMMGHKVTAMEDAYFIPWQIKLIDFYFDKCLPLLQFTVNIIITYQDSEMTKIRKEMDNLKRIGKKIEEGETLVQKAEKQREEAKIDVEYENACRRVNQMVELVHKRREKFKKLLNDDKSE